jgi:hypothetical protein
VTGDKVVAFCDRNCNVIAPFVSALATAMNPHCFAKPFRRELPTAERIAA